MIEIFLLFTGIALILCVVFVCLCIGSALGLVGYATSFLDRGQSGSDDRQYSAQTQPINSQCFICLERVCNQVVASCNHSYCGECIGKYLESHGESTINCPACRKEVLILFRRFDPVTPQQVRIKDQISSYNYKFTKEPSIWRAISQFGNTVRNVPILFSSSGLNYILRDSRLKYLILFAIYTFSPFDLIPEAILGPLGLLDDGIAVAGIIRQVSSILYGFVRQERQGQRQGQGQRRHVD